MNKRDRAKADAAYRAMFEAPLGEGVIRGQLDALSGDVAGVVRAPLLVEVDGIPQTCPGCGREQTAQRGWTPMAAAEGELTRIQCGGCATIFSTTAVAWAALRDRMRMEFGASDVPPVKKERAPKQRGAG